MRCHSRSHRPLPNWPHAPDLGHPRGAAARRTSCSGTMWGCRSNMWCSTSCSRNELPHSCRHWHGDWDIHGQVGCASGWVQLRMQGRRMWRGQSARRHVGKTGAGVAWRAGGPGAWRGARTHCECRRRRPDPHLVSLHAFERHRPPSAEVPCQVDCGVAAAAQPPRLQGSGPGMSSSGAALRNLQMT